MNYQNKAILWYNNEFKNSSLYKSMENTVEDSPYHRECNVAIHTDMVVSQYLSQFGPIWNKYHLYGFLVCVFHDVGKPYSEVIKYSESRGEYRAYHGHGVSSARLFEDYVYSQTNFFDLDSYDIFAISWMIENHIPWDMKYDVNKNQNDKSNQNAYNFIKTLIILFDLYIDPALAVFTSILKADTYGRISDDAKEKYKSAEDWIYQFEEWTKYLYEKNYDNWLASQINYYDKVLFVPIGPSGCGKSTHYKNFKNVEYYSWDQLRLDWYPSDSYTDSFKMACDDDQFKTKCQKEFLNLLKSNKSIYVDNTNISKKSRKFFINEARNQGYFIIGVIFPMSINQLESQQKYRTDKIINESVYKDMYMRINQPSYGEFDNIFIINNIKQIRGIK